MALGLGIAGVAGVQYYRYVQAHKETVPVVVAAHNIMPYSEIRLEDLKIKQVLKGAEIPNTVTSPEEAAGKMALSLLYADEQIRLDKLGNKDLLAGRQIIGININITRAAGGWLHPGDRVDVWWIPSESVMDVPGAGWSLAADDAVLLDLRDSAGRSVFDSQQSVLGQAPTGPAAIAVLAVKKEQAGKVVGAASPGSQNAVLALRLSAEQTVPEPAAETVAEPQPAPQPVPQPAKKPKAAQPAVQPAPQETAQ